jgi:hypothetical protein
VVGVGGDVDQLPGGVGEQPSPHPLAGDLAGGGGGDRADPDRLGGLLVGPGQGAQRDDDPDLGGPAVPVREPVVGQAVRGEVGEHVGAGLVQGPHRRHRVAVLGGGAGGGVPAGAFPVPGLGEQRGAGDPLVAGLDLDGGGDPFQPGQPVGQPVAPHPAVPGGGPAAGLGGGRVGGQHRPAQAPGQLRQGLAGGPGQHPGLHRPGGGVAQRGERVGDGLGLAVVDPPGGQRGPGAGQPVQVGGELDPGPGRGRGDRQPGGDLDRGDLPGGDLVGAGPDPAQPTTPGGDLGGGGDGRASVQALSRSAAAR